MLREHLRGPDDLRTRHRGYFLGFEAKPGSFSWSSIGLRAQKLSEKGKTPEGDGSPASSLIARGPQLPSRCPFGILCPISSDHQT